MFGRVDIVVFNRNVNTQTYMHKMLTPVVVASINQHFWGHKALQLDNNCQQSALQTRNFLATNKLTFDWPVVSPGKERIERMWDALKRRIDVRVKLP